MINNQYTLIKTYQYEKNKVKDYKLVINNMFKKYKYQEELIHCECGRSYIPRNRDSHLNSDHHNWIVWILREYNLPPKPRPYQF